MAEQNNEYREAMDRLNESNRILVEARMLSRSKPLTIGQRCEIVDQFTCYTQEHGIPLARVAKEIDFSESVVSQWRSGTYQGNVEEVTRAINGWMERDARRVQAEKPKDSVSTWVATTIHTIACQADKQGMMAAIVSPAGSGKTKVLKALAQEMRGLYLYCTEALTPREFLLSLAHAMGKKPGPATEASLMRLVVEALQGTRRIILLDEAHQLKKAIRCVRAIHDQAQVPIIMAGTYDILRFVDDRTDGRGQFSRRTLRCNLMDYVRNAQDPDGNAAGRDLFSIEEIRAFFEMRRIRLASDAMHLMWALACLPNYGTLGLIGTVADIAASVNQGAQVLSRQQVLAALQMVVGGVEAKYVKTLADKHAEHSERKAMVA